MKEIPLQRQKQKQKQALWKQQLQFPLDSPMFDFINTNLSKSTKQRYIAELKMFFDSLGLKASESINSLRLEDLIDRQSREFLVRAKQDRDWAQNGLKYFIYDKKQKAENGELAAGTVRNFYKPVKLFCKVHDILLSWDRIAMILPRGRKFANDRAPTKEEIQTVIKYPDRRIRPLTLVTCSSGIRIGAWEYLKWKHVEPIKRDGKIVAAKITVYAGEYEQYFSFITPEAFQALQEWMDYRKKSGEEITGESWLIRSLWDTTGPTASDSAASPIKMSVEAIKAFVNRALRSQGLRTVLAENVHRHEFKTSHGFRKFFQTTCESNMKSLDVMILMGQDTGLAASYNKPTVEMLLTEYLKAVDSLTIDKVQTDEEVIKNQQALAAEMQTKDKEIQELKGQMAEMRDLVEKLNGYVELYKPAFETVMKQLNPHLEGKFINIDDQIGDEKIAEVVGARRSNGRSDG